MERQALLSFKKGVIDPTSSLSSWSIKKDCCQWHGVQCDNITGKVTSLNLGCSPIDVSSNCLRLGGEIILPLFLLESLNSLDLSGNDFQTFHLYPSNAYRNLLGTMPPHFCGNFSNLKYLDLSYNINLHMDNIQWISHLPSLKILDLSGIDLHKETHWIQHMSVLLSLSELLLRSCQLTDVIPGVGWFVNFTSLQYLDLSENYFDFEISKLVLNLSDEFSALILESNKLKGPIPDTLRNLRNLEYLMLSGNELNGTIPDWLGEYKHMQYLEFYGNSLQGPIPATIGNLSELISLELSYNHLHGFFPSSLGKLSNLENLLVGGNSLVGVASKMNFTKLIKLQMLDLSSSSFIFDMDSNWTPPSQLAYVYLHASKLGSVFPTWLYSLEYVHYLNISSSGISSIVEDKLWSLAKRTTCHG
ncbi:receptor-like protein EIX2 [Prosopis cineraria]|uniref:receptor-like protein EIX2 n=1 Tax=Prosopis cineraria TaxID=364024 RepID=UPI00240FBFDF|nr:receptor-like protein EIX2 [Prosopis cineraria]